MIFWIGLGVVVGLILGSVVAVWWHDESVKRDLRGD